MKTQYKVHQSPPSGSPGCQWCQVKHWVTQVGLKTGIAAFVVVVVMSFNLAAWSLRVHIERHNSKVFEFNTDDEVSLSGLYPYSMSALCSQVNVTTNYSHAHFHLIDTREVLTTLQRDAVVLQLKAGVISQTLYLLAGSLLRLSACGSTQGAVVDVSLIIGGRDNRRRTTEGFTLSSPGDKECNETLLQYSVQADNFYTVAMPGEGHLAGQVFVHVDRSTHSLQSPLNACHHQLMCSFPIDSSRALDIVATFGHTKEMNRDNDVITLRAQCATRRWFWWSVFGSAPIVICLLSLIVCCVCGRNSDKSRPWSLQNRTSHHITL